MASSTPVSEGNEIISTQYNNLRADIFAAHHQDAEGIKIVNADIASNAVIAFSKMATSTVNRALKVDAGGIIVVSSVTAVELEYLSGIVSKPVANSGNETVAGIKTFGSIPVLPASDPTTANQVARKDYVDKRPVLKLIASENLKYSADTERNVGPNAYTYTLKKQITIRNKGTIRVKFDLKADETTYYHYGQIYVNSVAVGTQRDIQGAGALTYQTFSEDININADDLVQLYIKTEAGGSSGLTYCRNFRIYYDKSNPADGTVDTD